SDAPPAAIPPAMIAPVRVRTSFFCIPRDLLKVSCRAWTPQGVVDYVVGQRPTLRTDRWALATPPRVRGRCRGAAPGGPGPHRGRSSRRFGRSRGWRDRAREMAHLVVVDPPRVGSMTEHR